MAHAIPFTVGRNPGEPMVSAEGLAPLLMTDRSHATPVDIIIDVLMVALEEHRLSTVDAEAVGRAISWNRLSAELADMYQAVLGSSVARRQR